MKNEENKRVEPDSRGDVIVPRETSFSPQRRAVIKAALLAAPGIILLTSRNARAQGTGGSAGS